MAAPRPEPPPPGRRLTTQLRLKIAIWLGLAAGICVPYFGLQHVSLFPSRQVPVTPLDGAIAFDPSWIWAYVSLGLLVPLAPLVATTREQLLRYARGLAMLCGACFVAFLLWPMDGPRPAELPPDALYRAIVGLDRPSNSLPSLHAGLTAYSLLFGCRVLATDLGRGPRRLLLAGALAWAGLILFSTLATKQHWVADLPAGIAIAWAAHAIAWRDARPGSG